MHRLLSETVFFAVRMLLVTALVLCAPEFSRAQSNQQPGGFFSKRLTVAAGIAYSPLGDNIPASTGILFSPRLFLATTYSDFSVSIDPSPQLLYSFSDSQGVSEKLFF